MSLHPIFDSPICRRVGARCSSGPVFESRLGGGAPAELSQSD
jgi:hypothetical protein